MSFSNAWLIGDPSVARRRRLGAQEFERFYEDLFGSRWQILRAALLDDPVYAQLSDGLAKPYFLDRASLLAAATLDVVPGQQVLDLCAAPGGKTLVLALALAGRGELIANDRSATRRSRLHRVLRDHLPDDLRTPITVTGHDASRWGVYEPSAYDRVLADVPCSSERHVIVSASAIKSWSPSRTKRLAGGAYAIACGGADALRPGGQMVYSTCALSPMENDGVVNRLIARGQGHLVVKHTHEGVLGVSTEYGLQIMPDRDAGLGPMYIAVIEKRLCPLPINGASV